MKYNIDVYLRDTRDGFTGIYTTDREDRDDLGFDDWMWTEGNYECDCNRSMFLYPSDESKELDCNIGANIIVIDKIVRQDTDEILYSETNTEGA